MLETISRTVKVVAVVDDASWYFLPYATWSPDDRCFEPPSRGLRRQLVQVGNHFDFHGYMVGPILRFGDVVVLHDLSLFDFFWAMCRGSGTGAFAEEIAYDSHDQLSKHDVVDLMRHGPDIDRLKVPMVRRFVEERAAWSSVHSLWEHSCSARYDVRAEGCRS